MTKHILGLDLGTNSIGWALVKQDFEKMRLLIVASNESKSQLTLHNINFIQNLNHVLLININS
jgi:CRISPR/Cas system Type II protein with McrA/HNH and RuvC-like nuclease domain